MQEDGRWGKGEEVSKSPNWRQEGNGRGSDKDPDKTGAVSLHFSKVTLRNLIGLRAQVSGLSGYSFHNLSP